MIKVFSTSPSPDSCTMGVWAAYDPRLKLIILDTEGKSQQTIKDIEAFIVVLVHPEL